MVFQQRVKHILTMSRNINLHHLIRYLTAEENLVNPFFRCIFIFAFVTFSLMLSSYAYASKRFTLQRFTPHYAGRVVADEPQAQKIGQDVLQRGGNAVDAAVATSFALAVTLPSRASLGGGGACIAWHPGETTGQAFLFPSRPAVMTDPSADRPAGVPTMARGLYGMQQKLGRIDFPELVQPAQQMSIEGVPVGSLLYADLVTVHTALFADPKARDIFSRNDGQMLGHNDTLFQKELHGTLTHIVHSGVGSLYAGALAHAFIEQAHSAGAGLTMVDMRNNSLPVQSPTLDITQMGATSSFLPPPGDGGLAMAYSWLTQRPAVDVIFPWRLKMAQGGDGSIHQGELFLAQYRQSPAQSNNMMPPLPASTSLVTSDKWGGAVSCGLSMNNLFGTGRVAGETGIVLSASPTRRPQPLFPLAIMHDGKKKLFAVVSANGQNQAADEAAYGLRAAQSGLGEDVRQIRGYGWANVISCIHGTKANGKCASGMLSKP